MKIKKFIGFVSEHKQISQNEEKKLCAAPLSSNYKRKPFFYYKKKKKIQLHTKHTKKKEDFKGKHRKNGEKKHFQKIPHFAYLSI